MMDHLYIFKSDVFDIEYFRNSINLHNCRLINGPYTTEEELYYILEGSSEDIESFQQDWNKQMVSSMDEKTILFDLYLYILPENDKLTKISHLTRECAEMYAKHWFEMNELHEYMLVTEGSTPWSEPIPTIVEKTPEWLFLEYQKLSKV